MMTTTSPVSESPITTSFTVDPPDTGNALAQSTFRPRPSGPGYRIPLDYRSGSSFPSDVREAGPPVAKDEDGSPVFMGSAILPKEGVHPCKICPNIHIPCHVPFGGRELLQEEKYDLLPFDANTMEWVDA